MKEPETESIRWFDQAKCDLHTSRWDAKGNLFAPACFWAQQSAEKAAKAYLYSNRRKDSTEAIKMAQKIFDFISSKLPTD
jgi:HEPN domain-containing protein